MKKHLDLGCGPSERREVDHEYFGLDINDMGKEYIKTADLAWEPIPFPDNEFDLVTAYDFMEHIPMSIYYFDKKGQKRNSMVELFNEIYRVLKPGGEFYMVGPIYDSVEAYRDPTHVSFWTDQNLHYFSGDYYGFHDHYGHTSRFQILENRAEGSRFMGRLRAMKNTDGEYKINYD